MPEDFDPLEDLREAWQSLEAPEPADELDAADARTREVVAWLRAAWRTVEPARQPRVPAGASILRPRFGRPALLRLAAAALILALGAAVFWRPGAEAPGRPGEDEPAEPVVADGPGGPVPEVIPEQPVPEGRVQLASLSSEHIEMRSGPVRLILLTGDGHPADGGANHEDVRNDDITEEER